MSQQYFQQAELALAAYANLEPDVNIRDELRAAGLSATQTDKFISQYTVIDHHSDATGLSATVFKSTDPDNPQTFLAIRGTNDLLDLLTDLVNIALFGSTALQPQYLNLKNQVQTWMNDDVLPQNFTVTGHSLGGFLATDLTVDSDFASNITHAYLYNTPGQGGIFGELINMMQNAWGIPTQYDPTKFSNIEAVVSDGFNIRPIAGLGFDVLPPINIMIEDQLSGVANPEGPRNHSIVTLTGALDEKQFYSSSIHSKKQSDKPFYAFIGEQFSLKIRECLKKLLFGIFFIFFINQNAFSEDYDVNPAIDKDFIAWSNSIPKDKAADQLKDFLSSFDSWEKAKAWLVAKGFKIDGPMMRSETVNKLHGINQSPLFSAGAIWGPDEQGIIFAHNWLLKLESKLFVYGISVGLLFSEAPFTVHRVKIVETRL